MLKLNLQKQPYWLELAADVRVHVRPLSTAIMSAAQAQVIKKIVLMRDMRKSLLAENKYVADLPDVDDEGVRLGLSEALLIKALARGAIFEWEGVLQPDNDAVAPICEQTVDDLMDIWFIAQEFWKQYTSSIALLEAEGNGSRPVANGTSVAGRNTANPARKRSSPAAKAKQAP